jgi:anion-transporting  ArsA/GET3 family ATPase
VASVPGLSALEIDPQDAAQQYRARIVDPIKGFCLMTSLTVSTNSFLVHVPQRLRRLMNLPVY